MRAAEFVTERKKKKRKNKYFGGYWYPGYGYYGGSYYGSGDGNGGGDGGGGESVVENSNTKIDFKIQKGPNKFQTTLMIGDTAAGIYQYDSASGRSIAEIQPEFQGQGLGKLLVLHAINTAANLGMDFVEDESRTAAYDNVLDSLESSGYIISDDGYLYITNQGLQYLQQSLKQDLKETVIGPDDPVDVYIRGKHRGETITKLVARNFPNKNIPLLIRRLETNYGVNPNAVVYGPSKIQNENFADGKIKGKSRPGRVKRAGASCTGSVSELRARAKKYGGERGRMYHWCANMKGGRKK